METKTFAKFDREIKGHIEKSLEKLYEKHSNESQVLNYLYGLEVNDGVKYWDYINTDALLGLQHPKTNFSDELIFIVYHQICELYFKLVINEIAQIQKSTPNGSSINPDIWNIRLERAISYFDNLTKSFNVLSSLDTEEFYFFRMALLPASGYQTAQFRQVEIMLTDLDNLIPTEEMLGIIGFSKSELPNDKYEQIYWKLGARDLASHKKSPLLENFESKYDDVFEKLVDKQTERNLFRLFTKEKNENSKESVKASLSRLQERINEWKVKHAAVVGGHFKYFEKSPYRDGKTLNELHHRQIDPNKGTGDTNYKEFFKMSLKLSYFPDI